MKWNELVCSMKNGNESAIETALSSSIPLERVNGIVFAVAHHMKSFQDKLIELTKDDRKIPICHYAVSDFAIAALHTLGLREDKGDSHTIQYLMRTDFSDMLEQ